MPTTWDDDFDRQYYTEQEIDDSNQRVDAVQAEIDAGHGGLLPFERVAVDA